MNLSIHTGRAPGCTQPAPNSAADAVTLAFERWREDARPMHARRRLRARTRRDRQVTAEDDRPSIGRSRANTLDPCKSKRARFARSQTRYMTRDSAGFSFAARAKLSQDSYLTKLSPCTFRGGTRLANSTTRRFASSRGRYDSYDKPSSHGHVKPRKALYRRPILQISRAVDRTRNRSRPDSTPHGTCELTSLGRFTYAPSEKAVPLNNSPATPVRAARDARPRLDGDAGVLQVARGRRNEPFRFPVSDEGRTSGRPREEGKENESGEREDGLNDVHTDKGSKAHSNRRGTHPALAAENVSSAEASSLAVDRCPRAFPEDASLVVSRMGTRSAAPPPVLCKLIIGGFVHRTPNE
ncbi:hypothetical protein ONZ51_g3724 [Trametes cubensis]|uniref:Uncharacterized protein n=1 Tax=Trametes cubensis TaxID=1111947 RepID=A0AAD7TX54_9APHY|nr:hypothetical protein ONZ51_g3724 [Trametes cubensis]